MPGFAPFCAAHQLRHQIDGTSDTLSNTVLEELLYKNLQETPLPAYTEEEVAYAQALKATFPDSRLPGQLTEDNPWLLPSSAMRI